MKITGKTKVLGVIGDPIQHSRSPQMHNAAIFKLGIDYVYIPFHVKPEDVSNAIEGFKAINVVGINVTIPHKQSVLTFMDKLSAEADTIGAVNTIVFKDGFLEGHNTDAQGFLEAMKEEGVEELRGKSAVIIGAGGSARAVAVGLVLEGVSALTIANRTESKAIDLASTIAEKTKISVKAIPLSDGSGVLAEAILESSLLVNTTSVGMDINQPLLINPDLLHKDLIVYDIIYTPPETKLLKAAKERGVKVVGGIGMLVHQGAIAFQLWTGLKPPIDVMRRALTQSL